MLFLHVRTNHAHLWVTLNRCLHSISTCWVKPLAVYLFLWVQNICKWPLRYIIEHFGFKRGILRWFEGFIYFLFTFYRSFGNCELINLANFSAAGIKKKEKKKEFPLAFLYMIVLLSQWRCSVWKGQAHSLAALQQNWTWQFDRKWSIVCFWLWRLCFSTVLHLDQ